MALIRFFQPLLLQAVAVVVLEILLQIIVQQAVLAAAAVVGHMALSIPERQETHRQHHQAKALLVDKAL